MIEKGNGFFFCFCVLPYILCLVVAVVDDTVYVNDNEK